MKKCGKCGLEKLLKEFYRRKTGQRVGEYYEKCSNCMKTRGRSYYHLNKSRQLPLAKIRKLRYIQQRKKLLEEIKNRPCMDCGKRFPPWVMDFDHRNSQEKIASISRLTFWKMANFEKVKKEIEKCDLVCANCHRQRTYNRWQEKIQAEVANVVKAPL
ncbi:MAG: hypothetical protein AAB532_00915 [Patescibacteria group bacterium]